MGFLYPFVRHFRAQGWRVDGCARAIGTNPRAIEEFDQVFDLPLSRSVKDLAGMAQTVLTLRNVVARDYDIVHVHTPIAAFLARAVIRRMHPSQRPSVVYTAHGFHFHEGGHPVTNQAFLMVERVAGRWTDRLVVMNAEDFEAAKRYRIVPTRRLKYMRGIGVDTQWYAPDSVAPDAVQQALGSIGMDPTGGYFVTVGEFSRRKRPDDVVRALARMQDRKTRLLLLGDGPTRSYVKRVAAEAGVAERVFMPGKVVDIRPFVAGAVALVQASTREGLPRSIMEALSLEVPAVVTDARGQGELVGSDRGAVVPIGAVTRMAAEMDRLVRFPDERKAMGVQGRQLMVERYDLSLIIRDHEDLYGELLADASGANRHARG